MATETIFSGDTIRVKATFRDYAISPAVGPLTDPDDDETTIKIYNSEATVITTDDGIKESTGVYYYDWTAPETEGTYYFEFKGLFDTRPQLARQVLKVKFKPVS